MATPQTDARVQEENGGEPGHSKGMVRILTVIFVGHSTMKEKYSEYVVTPTLITQTDEGEKGMLIGGKEEVSLVMADYEAL